MAPLPGKADVHRQRRLAAEPEPDPVCICAYEGPDEAGNYEPELRPDCPMHGEAA
jgi:hypothetical protein